MRHTSPLAFAVLLLSAAPVRAALYIVGSAIGTGWNRQAMTEQGSGIYTWEGYLFHGGELKFMTEANGWGSHWGPSSANGMLVPGIPSSLASSTSATRSWSLQLDEDVYQARADIPSGTLTLFRDNDDAIVLPLSETDGRLYDLSGRLIAPPSGEGRRMLHGIVISGNRKVVR